MFLDRLNAKQQGALLGLATQLIEADGNISQEETLLLNALRVQMAANVSPLSVSLNELPSLFQSNTSKGAFLLELLGIAHADSEYHVSEKDFISKVAASLGISDTTLADMESWVCRQFALTREAEQFLEA
ncbi:TerB family tellurite resistance protein [Azonexus sp. IMCC34839]|uniref:TerB family tellurite resistance protein n=1 Tax=Azonexus sp. IMCC34839 TaxID=3133695 RepID=UPI00399A8DC6